MRIIGNDPSTPRQAQIVASGTLSTGDTVVVNADGTVSVVEETDVSQGLGSATVFTSNRADWLDSDFDVNANRVVVAYKDLGNNDYGTAVVGTISGTSISFGTPVVFRSVGTAYMAVTYEPVAQKVVISFEDDGPSGGSSIVGTVSGTSISFGGKTTFESGTCRQQVSTYDSTSGKIVIAYALNTFFKAVVGTVSGNSISFGTPAEIDQSSSSYRYTGIAYDPTANKIVVVGSDLGSSTRAKASVGTVSGTSISFGTQVDVNGSTQSTENPVVYDGSIQKVIVANNNNGNSGFVKIGTISGTSISFSSASTFHASGAIRIKMVYDSNAQKTVIYYGRGSGFNVRPTLIVGTASASSVSFGSDVYLTGETGDRSLDPAGLAFDSVSNKVITSYPNYTDTTGDGIVFQNASTDINLTAENYIGTAATGAPSGTGAKINLKGAVDENQSGLTAGQSYYVQTDGTLSTTPDDPSVFAGTAVAANKLIVKG
jgi:hypothetical protein